MKGLNGPILKSVGHGGDHLEVEFDDGTGLLDGGATHPLRQGSTEEIKNAVQVTVELAHGATQLYQNPVNGTLLSEGPVEPIVPLRGLVELGYTITWSRAGCVVKHPRLGNIECWLRSGCPVVRKDHALALITEIEHMEMEEKDQPSAHVGRAHGENQEVVGITISGKNLELYEGSRGRRSTN